VTPQPIATPAPTHDGVDEPRRRYRAVVSDAGRALVCGNASNIELRLAQGLTVTRRSRRLYPTQTIFLDGVYNGAPFCDNERRHYSLDHHAGCVRGFTLATCEQAVVLLLQGLPLSAGEWTVYVNDPDLDSVIAAWVLMNHLELLRSDGAALRAMMPLIRLEGVIDAHGTGMQVLAALPDELHARTKASLDLLMRRERELKSSGQWLSTDWVAYTRDLMEALDRLAFSPEALAELTDIQEDGRVALGERMALLLRSNDGIYAVEARLKDRYDRYLGVIVLDEGADRFTLRQVDSFLKKDLSAVYRVLNRQDPRARTDGDPPNLWGGSGSIGGAPRVTGSGLAGDEILAVLRDVLGPRESLWLRVLKRAGRSVGRALKSSARYLWRRISGDRSDPPALPPAGQ
jgi:hypothetical protein